MPNTTSDTVVIVGLSQDKKSITFLLRVRIKYTKKNKKKQKSITFLLRVRIKYTKKTKKTISILNIVFYKQKIFYVK